MSTVTGTRSPAIPATDRPAASLRAAALALLAAAGLLMAGCVSSPASTRVSGFAGVVQRPPLNRPTFTLTDTTGRPYDFAARTRGQLTLLYFGYTSCPIECPTTLATVASALRAMPATHRDKVRLVLVTTDPASDTGPVLRSYLDRFDPDFVGLTGTQAQVAHAEQVSSAQPSGKEKVAGDGSYLVAHTTWLYAYGTDDRARVVYGPDAAVADLRHDLPMLLAGTTPTLGDTWGLGAFR